MRVKRLVSLALAGMLAASVALTGCGSKKEATTSDGKTIVKIGTQQMPNDEGIAKAMNYFQEEIKGRDQDKVEIDYVIKKEVKKPASAKPGFVVYYTNYSMMASTDISAIKQAD